MEAEGSKPEVSSQAGRRSSWDAGLQTEDQHGEPGPGMKRRKRQSTADSGDSCAGQEMASCTVEGPAGGEVTGHAERRSIPDAGCQMEGQLAVPSGQPGPEGNMGRGEASAGLEMRLIGSIPEEPEPTMKQQDEAAGSEEGKGPIPSPATTAITATEPTAVSPRGGKPLGCSNSEEKQQRWWIVATAGEEGSSAFPDDVVSMYERPLPHRCAPYPSGASDEAVDEWNLECRKISELASKDPFNYPPILMKPKDPNTAKAVTSSRDKEVILKVARSIVGISSIAPDEEVSHFTGFIMNNFEANERARILTCSETVCDFDGKLLDRKLFVRLPNNDIFEGQLLFVDPYYDIALLEISANIKLWGLPCVPPNYGDEVFVLARGEDSSLMARHGSIKWLEEPYLDRNYYMFLSCQLPECGTGGPVIDKDGNVTGMAFELGCPDPAILSSSIILKCIEMQRKFSCIARPVHGLGFTTVELLNVAEREKLSCACINGGYIVNEVLADSTAERLGIRCGDVIESFGGMDSLSLPKLEESLLSVGSEFLEKKIHSFSKVVFKVRFYDLQSHDRRSVNLPLGFSCSPAAGIC